MPYKKTNLGFWTNALKELALARGAFVVAGSAQPDGFFFPKHPVIKLLEKLIPFGHILFAIMLVCFGIDHFLYAEGISDLVPNWIPGHIFWVYFAGVAWAGSGLAIIFNIQRKLIATLLGVMVLIWFIVMHIPRAIAQPFADKGNEITSAFLALAFSGIAFVIAGCSTEKGWFKSNK